MNHYFITGTGTEVGKTVVTALLAFGMRRLGVECVPIKPVASGAIWHDGERVSEDALFYLRLCDTGLKPGALSAVTFQRPASPHLAAELEGASIDPDAIFAHIRSFTRRYECVLAEGIGGWLVPINRNYLAADLARDLKWPVILAAANQLGAINHTLLTIESIRARGCALAGVIFTHPQPGGDADILNDNMETIVRLGGVDRLGTIPYLEPALFERARRGDLWDQIEGRIEWPKIL
ncbi:MAG: dethiobiotin synthase [bacterium]|nr:dethiobiotin synthase [bacterium]